MDDDLKIIVLIPIITIIGLAFLVLSVRYIQITFLDNIPSQVYVDEKLVYEGISAGL